MHDSECVVLRGYCRYYTALLPFGPSELVQLGSIMSDSECLATDVVDAAAELGFDKIVLSHIARIVPPLIPWNPYTIPLNILWDPLREARLDRSIRIAYALVVVLRIRSDRHIVHC